MTVKDKKEARRISYFGARKMDGQGYTWNRDDAYNWTCSAPNGNIYNVARYESGEFFCGCKFFEENAEHGTCKHTMRLEWLLKDEAERFAREEAEDALSEAHIRENRF